MPARTADHMKIRAVTELRRRRPKLYLEAMKGTSNIACALALMLGLVATAAPSRVCAQDDRRNDEAGREYFERGRAAFEEADYERALVYFEHAYRLSGRGELHYNIGVACDRLQREDEALEAFEQYLATTPNATREAEVRERMEALRQSIAERKATELALQEASMRAQRSEPVDGARLPKATIAGGTALAVIGAGGIAAMGVGLAKNGSCSEEVGGTCTVQKSATPWTWAYGGLGLAALAGSASWFAISAKRVKGQRETRFSLTPTGAVVSGKF